MSISLFLRKTKICYVFTYDDRSTLIKLPDCHSTTCTRRYFVSQALRLSLLLICENVPNSIIGLVLPLQRNTSSAEIIDPNDLDKLGLSLVGWLGLNRTFYSFLDQAPFFEFPTDFRLEPLRPIEKGNTHYNPLLIIQRDSRLRPLKDSTLDSIQRLLELVHRFSESWRPFFDNGMRDWAYQVNDFRNDPTTTDVVLDSIMDMVVALGGQGRDGHNKWSFCNLFMPVDTSIPCSNVTWWCVLIVNMHQLK